MAKTGLHPNAYNRPCGQMWADCGKAYQRGARRKTAPEPKPERELTCHQVKTQIGDRPGLAFIRLLRYVVNPRFSTRRITVADVHKSVHKYFPRYTSDAALRTLRARFDDVVSIFRESLQLNQAQATRKAQDLCEIAVAQIKGSVSET